MAADGDDDGFKYCPFISTSNIFYYNDNASHLGVLQWRRIPPNPIGVDPQQLAICSSSHGLVACRKVNIPWGAIYYVGNPYLGYDVGIDVQQDNLPDPYRRDVREYSRATHVVLDVDLYAVDPSYILICVVQLTPDDYLFEAYDSSDFSWYPSEFTIPHQSYGAIVPNSGVGCDRMAFWLLGETAESPSSLLVYDYRDDEIGFPKTIAFTYILPPYPRGQARMQLGRAMRTLGLVIVNEANSTVELVCFYPDFSSPWQSQDLFTVEILQADGDNVASWRQEDMTIVCREMPRPIRFDSYKVELLFWVQGRVFLLENNSNELHRYQLTVLPDEDVPSSITDGIPHVRTDNCRSDFKNRYDS